MRPHTDARAATRSSAPPSPARTGAGATSTRSRSGSRRRKRGSGVTRPPSQTGAVVLSVGWLLLAGGVAAGIALTGGPAGEWTTVYLIERSLSLDNVFLFSLLLAYFLVPPELRGRVLAIGIAGALALRGVAIAAGVTLIESIDAVVYAFGVL